MALAGLAKLAPIVPVPGNGKLRFQPVWVEDVVTCIVALLDEGGKGETIQLGGPEYYTYDQLLDQGRLAGAGVTAKSDDFHQAD